MKRALLENHKVLINPGIIDRQKFLSAVFALRPEGTIAEGTSINIKFEHCDTEEGEFEPVTDSEICLSSRIDVKTGTLANVKINTDEDINIDLDLIGCKQFIRITAAVNEAETSAGSEDAAENGENKNAAVTLLTSIVLGDCSEVPIQED